MESEQLRVQVLVATMHQRDLSIVERMNLSTDAIVANQADRTEIRQKTYDTFAVKMVTTSTRGLGINRNISLAHATEEILLFSDDDVIYYEGYAQAIQRAFQEHKDADAIIFNVDIVDGKVPWRQTKVSKRVRIYNALNYGSVRLAVRRSSLLRERISFSGCFGSGGIFSSGEDSLFLCDMLRRGFRIYTSCDTIAAVNQSESTWFRGYDEKYLYDKGALFYALFPGTHMLFFLQYLIRHREVYHGAELTLLRALSVMRKGIAGYKKMQPWTDASKEGETV